MNIQQVSHKDKENDFLEQANKEYEKLKKNKKNWKNGMSL